MRPAETARCHASLAQALRRYGADPAEAASHLAASGDSEGAAAAYAAAARRQLDRVCDREAMRLAEAGLSLDPGGRTRATLLATRGEARRRDGQLTAARTDFTTALDSLADPAARSRVIAELARLDARTADAARGSELAALAIAEAGDQPAALGQALAAAAIIDLAEGNLARARLLYWEGPASPRPCRGHPLRADAETMGGGPDGLRDRHQASIHHRDPPGGLVPLSLTALTSRVRSGRCQQGSRIVSATFAGFQHVANTLLVSGIYTSADGGHSLSRPWPRHGHGGLDLCAPMFSFNAVGSGTGAVAADGRAWGLRGRRFPGRLCHPSVLGQVCRVSSPRRLEPCVRFSRTRLTDAVHRRHSAFPASPGRAWDR
jgi:hypothetical protein